TSDNPSTATRTVSFQVDDGASSDNLSDPVTRDIDVTPVNDAPAVTTSDGSTSYTIGDTSGQPVDPAVAVADADATNLESARVTLSSGYAGGDELLFTDQNGITGSFDSDNGILNLSGTASVADYQTALQSVTFHDNGTNVSTSRTIQFVVN